MDEALSMTEIEAKFDSEWVLIEDPRTDETRIAQLARICEATCQGRARTQERDRRAFFE